MNGRPAARPARLEPLAPIVALAALGALAVPACAGQPSAPPPRVLDKADAPPAAAPALPPAAARWVDSSGATAVGPAAMAGGTLVLLGGRRALVAPDGAVRGESAPSPEPLQELLEVPTAAGRRLVGRGVYGVYRFDDPLGAPAVLARSEAEILRLGGGPGVVAIWDVDSDLPRFLDVATGKPAAMQGLPAPPLRAIAFRDAGRGAAIFEAAGLAVTTDGGASWRLVAEAGPGDALRVGGLRVRGDEVRAFAHAEGRDAPVDLAQAKLGPMDDLPAAPAEAPLLRWIRLTGRDPLEAAIASGVAAGPGVALAASHGLLARVDLATGLVVELVDFARGGGVDACGIGRAGPSAWVACALHDDAGADLYDPFGVLRVPLGGGKLAVEAPVLARNGEAELRTSPSGGAMLLAPCHADDEGVACVRQPSGKWITIRSETDLHDRGAGPLADGRIAFVRGLWAGDAPPAEEGGGPKDDDGDPDVPRPFIAVLGPGGKEARGAALGWAGRGGELRVVSPIEESEEHDLSFVVADEDAALTAVVMPLGRDAPSLQRLEGVTHARIRAGHGVAVGAGRVLASIDGGLSWLPAPAPRRVLAAIDHLGDLVDEPGLLAVNALGLKVDTQIRIGWGTGAAGEAPASTDRDPAAAGAPPGPALPPRAAPPPAGPEQGLACTSQGPGQGTPPLLGSHQIVAMLTKAAPAAPKGAERRVASASAGRWGMLDAVAVLEEQRRAGPGAPPGVQGPPGAQAPAWTLRWFDAAELGAKPRSWTGRAPPEATWGTTLRSVAAAGPRALFSLRSSGKHLLLRVDAGGRVAVADVPWELVPGPEVAFGADRDATIAWIHDTAVIVWRTGEAPRPIASVATHATRTLGQPGADGVPLLLGSTDWALLRTLPIPKPAKPAAGAPAAPAAPPLGLDGWIAAPNVRRELTRLPACGARPKGTRFLIHRAVTGAVVDGHAELGQGALYDVRIAGNEACVASMSVLLAPDRSAPRRAEPPKTGAATGPVGFARADFVAKKAEGGDRGADAQASMRRLACVLAPRP